MADTNLLHEIASVALSVIAVVLGVLVTYYIPRLARTLEQKFRVDIPDRHESEAKQVAIKAIALAEERGRAAAKQLGERIPGSDKLQWAAEYFRDNASTQTTAWLNDKVEDWLQVQLGMLRLGSSVQAPPAGSPSSPASPDTKPKK